jgi:uncharacterized protein YcgI (DUF1989 family)
MAKIQAGHGKAFRVKTGQKLKIVNIDGAQVVDTWAFDPKDLFHRLSMEISRRYMFKLRPSLGDVMHTNYRVPIIKLVEDTSNGIHDTLIAACDPATYEKLGAPKEHRSCAGNLHESLAEIGETLPYTPGPLNLFMNVPVSNNLDMSLQPSMARPGDFVVIEALMDAIIVLSSCPMDLVPTNSVDCRISDIDVEVFS